MHQTGRWLGLLWLLGVSVGVRAEVLRVTLQVEPPEQLAALQRVVNARLADLDLPVPRWTSRGQGGATVARLADARMPAERLQRLLSAPSRFGLHAAGTDAGDAVRTMVDPASGMALAVARSSLLPADPLRSVQREPLTLDGRPALRREFRPKAAAVLRQYTEAHLGQRVAVVLDDQVLVAPIIQSVISDGQVQITGLASEAEVDALLLQLSQPAFPAGTRADIRVVPEQ